MASHPVRDHCLAPGREAEAAHGAGGYGRMFPDLPALRDGEEFFRARGREAVAGRPSPCVDRDPSGATTDADGAAGWPVFASLAVRDLQRGRATGLPSGEAVAAALGVEPLTAAEIFGLGDLLVFAAG